MADCEPLRKVVEDLIEVMRLQTKELEKLVERVEQIAGHLAYQPQFSVVSSELSELRVRVQKLSARPEQPGT
jgi:hypothetical protein